MKNKELKELLSKSRKNFIDIVQQCSKLQQHLEKQIYNMNYENELKEVKEKISL